MRRKLRLLAVLVVLTAIMSGCAGVETVRLVVDEEATISGAQDQMFKFCHILDEEVCQSPDSSLVFHLPRVLNLTVGGLFVSDELVISNKGLDPVTIDECFITLIDDRDILYRPEFTGPGDYDETMPFMPALVLAPGQDARVHFRAVLQTGSRAVRSIHFLYKRPGDRSYTQVRVSYKPRGLKALNNPARR